MKKLDLSQRVDFTYLIGAFISLVLINIAIFSYKDSGLPMIFALVSFFTYVGVLIRGFLDKASWGKTQRQMKISAFVGFTSIFIIFSVVTALLVTWNFELSKDEIKNILIYGGVGVILLYILFYIFWFRKMTYREFGNS